MRRRRNRGRALTADEVVREFVRAKAAAAGLPQPQRAERIRAELAEVGTDPLTAVCAAYWVRRGRPADFWAAVENGWH